MSTKEEIEGIKLTTINLPGVINTLEDDDESGDVVDRVSHVPLESSRRESSSVGKYRHISINSNDGIVEKYGSNRISTAKYSFISFIPSFLFEQFRRYQNIFFLSIALLQQIPDVSPTGRFTTLVPLICILSVSALKEIIEDYKRHCADRETNNRNVEVLRHRQWENIRWRDVVVGDFVKIHDNNFFPADLILFSSSEPQGLCYIETSNLDGETNLKVRQGLPETSKLLEAKDLANQTGFLDCQLPNRHLYEFAGKLKLQDTEELALGPEQVLLRGAKLQNTNWVFGLVVYTGHETKLLKNSTAAPLKRSTVDKLTNTQILFLFGLLIFVSLVSATFSHFFETWNQMWYLGKPETGFTDFLYNVLTFVILYNNLIPISLTVTLEVVRFIQAMFISMDADMYYPETNTPAMARTSNLNEELGQVSYIFSDKTGTLTRNIMEFKGLSINGLVYSPSSLSASTPSSNPLRDTYAKTLSSPNGGKGEEIREMLTLLAVCHTVIPERSTESDELVYHAASPDERALVYGAASLGYVFESRTPSHVVIRAWERKETYEVLNVLEFTSTRKRMSVIVRGPDGKIKLFTKGADSMIYDRLAPSSINSESLKASTLAHLEEFASEGLRTLCCAMAEISPKNYEEWRGIYHKAATAINNRELKLEEASNLIETNLKLLGATAIEDKLQDQVPETISALIKAGISIWVLTGDKQETAINIGYSSKLLTPSMSIFLINTNNLDDTRSRIVEVLTACSSANGTIVDKGTEAALVIDGTTLNYALSCELKQEFLKLCSTVKSVICCRASPIQKAEIVESVTEWSGKVTLAIGDGANDVAMIQKAHVGIGISGVEGLQAASASDYTIAQFRFLTKLLFVHGAWNYDRMCKLIFYSYYKNICLYIIELWFAIYSGWSGQVIFERWTIGLYNMLFTCAQPIAMGVCERSCSTDMRLKYPLLYGRRGDKFSLRTFFTWLATSVLHSILLFWLPLLAYGDGNLWGEGKSGGYLVLGNIIYTYVVTVVSLKSGLETKSWTKFTFLSIFGSIFFWFIFLSLYSLVYRIRPGGPFGNEICGIAYMVFSAPVFWFGLLLVPLITLLFDLIFKSFRNTFSPNIEDKFRICEVMNRDPNAVLHHEKLRSVSNTFDDRSSVSACLLRLSETARLLRNVRNVFRRPTEDHATEVELSHGYAFSQEEHGVVRQSDLIRNYDTTVPKPGGM